MTITNNLNLPHGLVAAVSPKKHNEPGSLSAARQSFLSAIANGISYSVRWNRLFRSME